MILIDSSVWIGHLRDVRTEAVETLRSIENMEDILVGDLILLEVLQGARDEAHAARLEVALREFSVAPMLGVDLAVRAAANYRLLRTRGVTVRKTVDVIIATFCIGNGHMLLHDDRDFVPFAEHLGLQVF